MKKSELVERIDELLRERGITRGTPKDYSGRLCLLGAGREAQDISAIPVDPLTFETASGWAGPANRADETTRAALGYINVPTFNDTSSDEEIFTLLETQAKFWRNRGE